jgi:hypothetical protein
VEGRGFVGKWRGRLGGLLRGSERTYCWGDWSCARWKTWLWRDDGFRTLYNRRGTRRHCPFNRIQRRGSRWNTFPCPRRRNSGSCPLFRFRMLHPHPGQSLSQLIRNLILTLPARHSTRQRRRPHKHITRSHAQRPIRFGRYSTRRRPSRQRWRHRRIPRRQRRRRRLLTLCIDIRRTLCAHRLCVLQRRHFPRRGRKGFSRGRFQGCLFRR